MSLLTFLAFFILFLCLSALIIIGFYIITRGERSIQPNGGVRLKGKIFKRWSLFWERTIGTTPVYISEEQLKEKYRWIRECNQDIGDKLRPNAIGTSLEILGTLQYKDLLYIQDVCRCNTRVDAAGVLFLFVDEPQYYFPEWLRYPLSQCPPCMASIGGSLLYWPVMLLAANTLDWTSAPHGAVYCYFWVLFCLALSALNKLFYNIIGS